MVFLLFVVVFDLGICLGPWWISFYTYTKRKLRRELLTDDVKKVRYDMLLIILQQGGGEGGEEKSKFLYMHG